MLSQDPNPFVSLDLGLGLPSRRGGGRFHLSSSRRSSRTPKVYGSRHSLREVAYSQGATAAARGHRPPRPITDCLRPSSACPLSGRPTRAGLSPDRTAGPLLRRQGSRSAGESMGWKKGLPGSATPSHSPWRLPRACSKQHLPQAAPPAVR